jgi:phosphate acyltransferase
LRDARTRLDYRRYGAVPLLGVNGEVFIGHGRSDAEAVANAIRGAAEADRHGVLDEVRQAIAARYRPAKDERDTPDVVAAGQ